MKYIAWEFGSMKFGNQNMKPPKLSNEEWLKSNKSRLWISKKNEIPSEFFARIILDFEEEIPDFNKILQQEINKMKSKKVKP